MSKNTSLSTLNKECRLGYGAPMYPLPSPPFPGSSPSPSTSPSLPWPVLPGMLILFPFSFPFPVDRKWLEPADSDTGGSRQEVISLQHLQPGNRTAHQGGVRTGRGRSHTYTNKCLTRKHPLTSPTAGTGTTTQETECEQSPQMHTAQLLFAQNVSPYVSALRTQNILYISWYI